MPTHSDSDNSSTRPAVIRVGHIAGAHGVRGDVLIKSYTEDPVAIADYGPLAEEDGSRCFEILQARVAKKGVVARLKGISDRNAAEALKGVVLTVARSALPPPEDDEWYQTDLVGLTVRSHADGDGVGVITGVQDFGAGSLLEVRLAHKDATVLIPFTRDVVPVVDVAAGHVIIDPPPGLIDEL